MRATTVEVARQGNFVYSWLSVRHESKTGQDRELTEQVLDQLAISFFFLLENTRNIRITSCTQTCAGIGCSKEENSVHTCVDIGSSHKENAVKSQ